MPLDGQHQPPGTGFQLSCVCECVSAVPPPGKRSKKKKNERTAGRWKKGEKKDQVVSHLVSSRPGRSVRDGPYIFFFITSHYIIPLFFHVECVVFVVVVLLSTR